MLFEVSPRDPLVQGSVVLALGTASMLATALPALRASRIDPNEASAWSRFGRTDGQTDRRTDRVARPGAALLRQKPSLEPLNNLRVYLPLDALGKALMTDKSLEIMQGTLELLVLKTLSQGEPMHGFAIGDLDTEFNL